MEPGYSCTGVWSVTSRQPSQLNLWYAVYAIKLSQRNGSKHKQSKPIIRATLFQQSHFTL